MSDGAKNIQDQFDSEFLSPKITGNLTGSWLCLLCFAVTWRAGRHLYLVRTTVNVGPEKAGVGGSTPSLATIILNNLAQSQVELLVSSRSAVATGSRVDSPATMIVKNLAQRAFSQSAFSPRSCAEWRESQPAVLLPLPWDPSLTLRL